MKLELYMFDTCPYCRRVLNYIANAEDRRRLIEVGGYEQVPCLFIDGKPMYESLDIIDWLKAHPQV